MRSLLLASAAVILTAGIACAQVAAPTPAPEGAPNAPQVAPPGAAYGKTAAPPANPTAAMSSSPASSSTSMAAPTPAPEGAPNAPQLSNAPGAAYGKTASAPAPVPNAQTAASADNSMGPGMSKPHHMRPGGGMPQDADARAYLHIASMAIKHHDKATADEALSRAETRMLTRSVVASGPMTDDSPAITAVRNARQAVNAGDFMEAAVDTKQAMHMHGGMGPMGAPAAAPPPPPGGPAPVPAAGAGPQQ